MEKTNQKKLIILLFFVFLFLRLFVKSPLILLAPDHLKFLELSKDFPHHTLSNKQLYLQHGPVYPYAIHFVNLLVKQDYIASILISLFSAAITFFILYRLFMMLTRDFYVTFAAMIFFTLSVELIIASREALREAFVIMLLIAAIYFYIKGVRFNHKASFIYASILGSLLALTSDHVVFLVPILILSYIFFNSERSWPKNLSFLRITYASLPILLILLFYGSWLAVKAYQYSTNAYYPAGLEGTPLRTKGFGLVQLISPHSFADYEPNAGIKSEGVISWLKHFAFNMGYSINLEPFSIPRGLNLTTMNRLLFPHHIFYMFLIYLPIALIALYGFILILKDAAKTKKIYNNAKLYFSLLFIILVMPAIQKTSTPKHIYPAYIFLFFILSYGCVKLFRRIGIKRIISANFLIILLLLLIPIWYYSHNNLVLFTKKVVASQTTGDFINYNLRKEHAIMAQPGYAYRLTYLTDNRVLGLPPKSEELLELIKHYNIRYLVFGNYYTFIKYYYSTDSINYILKHPEQFEFVFAIPEDYSDFYPKNHPSRTDEIYIYKVKSASLEK